jgi:hypothetical protein
MHAYDATLTTGEIQAIRDLAREVEGLITIGTIAPVHDTAFNEVRIEVATIYLSDAITKIVADMRKARDQLHTAYKKGATHDTF